MATTLEKARELMHETWTSDETIRGPREMKQTILDFAAEFADSLSAELREENARLREALENPSIEMLIEGRKQCFADCNGPYMGPNVERIWKAMARAALSKEKK